MLCTCIPTGDGVRPGRSNVVEPRPGEESTLVSSHYWRSDVTCTRLYCGKIETMYISRRIAHRYIWSRCGSVIVRSPQVAFDAETRLGSAVSRGGSRGGRIFLGEGSGVERNRSPHSARRNEHHVRDGITEDGVRTPTVQPWATKEKRWSICGYNSPTPSIVDLGPLVYVFLSSS